MQATQTSPLQIDILPDHPWNRLRLILALAHQDDTAPLHHHHLTTTETTHEIDTYLVPLLRLATPPDPLLHRDITPHQTMQATLRSTEAVIATAHICDVARRPDHDTIIHRRLRYMIIATSSTLRLDLLLRAGLSLFHLPCMLDRKWEVGTFLAEGARTMWARTCVVICVVGLEVMMDWGVMMGGVVVWTEKGERC
jgi:hypothetical protein